MGQPLKFDGNSKFLESFASTAPPEMLLRELLQNSIEAHATKVFVEPLDLTEPNFKYCHNNYLPSVCTGLKMSVLDNGVGMNGPELQSNMLHLFRSGGHKKFVGDGGVNYGVGARAEAVAKNPYGMFIESWQNGKGYRVIVTKSPINGDYELMSNGRDDPSVVDQDIPIPQRLRDCFKGLPDTEMHGTRVTLMGVSGDHSTISGSSSIKYARKRYFRLPKNVEMRIMGADPTESEPAQIKLVISMHDSLCKESLRKPTKAVPSIPCVGSKTYACAFGDVIIHYMKRDDDILYNVADSVSSGVRTVWSGEIYESTRTVEIYRALGIVYKPLEWAIFIELPSHAFCTKMDRTAILHQGTMLPFDPFQELTDLVFADPPEDIKKHQDKLAQMETKSEDIKTWINNEFDKMHCLNRSMTTRIQAGEFVDEDEEGEMNGDGETSKGESDGSGGDGGGSGGDGKTKRKSSLHKSGVHSPGTKKNAFVIKDLIPDVAFVSFTAESVLVQENLVGRAGAVFQEHFGLAGKLLINTDFPVYRQLLKKLEFDYKNFGIIRAVCESELQKHWAMKLLLYIVGVKLTFENTGLVELMQPFLSDQNLSIQARSSSDSYNKAKISLDGKKNNAALRDKVTRELIKVASI